MPYDPNKVSTEALHAVRALTGDTQSDKLKDSEITFLLAGRGLTATSDPVANGIAVLRVAAAAHDMLASQLVDETEVVVEAWGMRKRDAAMEHRIQARVLRERAMRGGKPSFANPSDYPTTHVPSVDPLPALE